MHLSWSHCLGSGDYGRRRCSERDVSGDRRHRVSGSLHRSPRRGSRSPTLSWADCSDGFLCATAVVPLNYNRPSDEQIDLAVIYLARDRRGQAIACNRESTAAYRNARLLYWSSETHSPTGRRVVGRIYRIPAQDVDPLDHRNHRANHRRGAGNPGRNGTRCRWPPPLLLAVARRLPW